jgi:hypothetical protein
MDRFTIFKAKQPQVEKKPKAVGYVFFVSTLSVILAGIIFLTGREMIFPPLGMILALLLLTALVLTVKFRPRG